MSAETSEWIDGPGLVDWLRGRGLENVKALGIATETAITRWRRGARANIYAADRALTQLGHHLSEIPEDLWISAPLRSQKLDEAGRAELLRRLNSGEAIKPLASSLGISPSTVRYHRNRQSRM